MAPRSLDDAGFPLSPPGYEFHQVGSQEPRELGLRRRMRDYSLSASGQTQFSDIAAWLNGDPPFDFEGDARPDIDGTADYAGADVP